MLGMKKIRQMKGFYIKLIIMEWGNYDNVKLDKQSLLCQVRNNWHIELPSQFIELIVNFNNGVPKKNVFDTEVGQRMLGSFLNFNIDANYNAFEVWESIKKDCQSWYFQWPLILMGTLLVLTIEII